MSHSDLLTCDDASSLTRCHRAFVSNSCHFFRTPLSIPWRHIQSLMDADQPVRKVPSRDGYPRRSSRIQRRWSERPSRTVYLISSFALLNACRAGLHRACAPLLGQRRSARPRSRQHAAEAAVARRRPRTPFSRVRLARLFGRNVLWLSSDRIWHERR